ncbi:MAG: ABC transporter permease subunit [Chloroflexi bacterium]|nr:ABC transporter permease subunit [Chloroflexota bacterium]
MTEPLNPSAARVTARGELTDGRLAGPVPPARALGTGARLREAALGLILALPPFIVLVALIVYPAIEAILFSLGRVPTDNAAFSTGMHLVVSNSLTLEVYRQLFASQFFQDDLRLTLEVTVLSVVFVLVISYILALYVRFGSGLLPAVVRSLYLIPMFVPVVIASYALITFYVDHGILQAVLSHLGLGYSSPIYHEFGIVIGEVWVNIPFAVLLLGSGLDALPQEMIEAAQDAGAGFFSVLWRIILPLNIVPAMIVVTFTFIGVLGSFTVPYLLGPNAPQMLGVAMQAYFTSYQQPQPAVAMAVLTFLLAAIAGGVYVWATARSGKAV